jgi:NDP-sugar pyrophosphorylase family protein
MNAATLAGARRTRLSEETHVRAKPMVEVGLKPSSGTS